MLHVYDILHVTCRRIIFLIQSGNSPGRYIDDMSGS